MSKAKQIDLTVSILSSVHDLLEHMSAHVGECDHNSCIHCRCAELIGPLAEEIKEAKNQMSEIDEKAKAWVESNIHKERVMLPDPVIQSLKLWMAEVTSLLCYQPEIPMAHKTDLCNALTDFDKALAFYTGKATVDQSL
jgi:hypothetical protein